MTNESQGSKQRRTSPKVEKDKMVLRWDKVMDADIDCILSVIPKDDKSSVIREMIREAVRLSKSSVIRGVIAYVIQHYGEEVLEDLISDRSATAISREVTQPAALEPQRKEPPVKEMMRTEEKKQEKKLIEEDNKTTPAPVEQDIPTPLKEPVINTGLTSFSPELAQGSAFGGGNSGSNSGGNATPFNPALNILNKKR